MYWLGMASILLLLVGSICQSIESDRRWRWSGYAMMWGGGALAVVFVVAMFGLGWAD